MDDHIGGMDHSSGLIEGSVLAVCFGHQLAGEALGGRVEINPAGPEYGTIEVALTTAGKTDPLFIGIPPIFHVQSTHRDSLIQSPDAVLLASTPNTKWQAFRWGGYLRAVQFHPETSRCPSSTLSRARNRSPGSAPVPRISSFDQLALSLSKVNASRDIPVLERYATVSPIRSHRGCQTAMSKTRKSTAAAAEISRINAFFPIMPLLGNHWAATRPFDGLTIGISAHLTTLTGCLIRELTLGGGTWALCGASHATTDPGVVQLLRDNGVHVYTTGSQEDYHIECKTMNPIWWPM